MVEPPKKDISYIGVVDPVELKKSSNKKKKYDRNQDDKTPLRQFGKTPPKRTDPFKKQFAEF